MSASLMQALRLSGTCLLPVIVLFLVVAWRRRWLVSSEHLSGLAAGATAAAWIGAVFYLANADISLSPFGNSTLGANSSVTMLFAAIFYVLLRRLLFVFIPVDDVDPVPLVTQSALIFLTLAVFSTASTLLAEWALQRPSPLWLRAGLLVLVPPLLALAVYLLGKRIFRL